MPNLAVFPLYFPPVFILRNALPIVKLSNCMCLSTFQSNPGSLCLILESIWSCFCLGSNCFSPKYLTNCPATIYSIIYLYSLARNTTVIIYLLDVYIHLGCFCLSWSVPFWAAFCCCKLSVALKIVLYAFPVPLPIPIHRHSAFPIFPPSSNIEKFPLHLLNLFKVLSMMCGLINVNPTI